ncbi:MAG: 3-deoxy-manno-octulosonate cytidylyltransferase [Methylocystis sp.]|uniref:3-deoxy-manno-octulosonate cytidylyltransferase n=1 Tax=Methylocystis sp. TaxID=1911079 RepID=UPI003DA69A01
MKTAIVIPARYASSRFPGKPLHPVLGVSMLERVWRIATSARNAADLLIATEDQRIVDFAQGFGGRAVLTSEACANGTERTAEALKTAGIGAEIIINLQGDALLTPPWVLDAMIDEMRGDPGADIVTPAVRLEGRELDDFLELKKSAPASGTSVVFDNRRHALYFSKRVIPFMRQTGHAAIHRHIGLYAFRADSLDRYVRLPQTPLEKAEGLEQLRALEHGMTIKVAIVDYRGRSHGSIDSPEDVAFVETIIAREGELVGLKS